MLSKIVLVALFTEASAGCSGKSEPAVGTCYQGSAGPWGFGETIKLHVKEYANGAGQVDLVGSGALGFTCANRTFNKSGQKVSVDLSHCLPRGVEVSDVEYCSDTDTVDITVKDVHLPIPIGATLEKVPCDQGEFNLLTFASCKGLGNPPSGACYQGGAKKLGESEDVVVEIKSFAAGDGVGNGVISLSGHGAMDFSCTNQTFSKRGQEISTDLSQCVKSNVVSIKEVEYCSDSDQIKVVVKVVHVPFGVPTFLSKVACKSDTLVV